MVDIEKLEALAEAVENKEWNCYTPGGAATNPMRASFLVGPRRETMDRSEGFREADAAFIAASNPGAVLELIAELKSLRSQVAPDSWQSGYDEGRKMGTKTALSEREQLKADNEALRSKLSYAAEEVESWGAYAPEYFQQKHDLTGTVERVKAAAREKP